MQKVKYMKNVKIQFLSDCEVKKGYGWKIIFMCNTDWKSGGHYAAGITHFKRSRSDRKAEDTRNSIHLLNHFDIKTPLTSYHEYNKVDKAYQLVEKMQARHKYRADHGCGYAGYLRSGRRSGADLL